MCAVLTVTAKNLIKQPLCPVFALGTSQLQVMRVKYWANSLGEGFFIPTASSCCVVSKSR